MEQKIYLQNQAWEEALALMMRELGPRCQPENEPIKVSCALGRITGETVRAQRSSPHYPAAAMDGYAVRARETFGLNERQPRWFQLGSEALSVDTGDPMPKGMDAVVMLEEVLNKTEEAVLLQQAVVPWSNVRAVGEDIVEGEILLPIHHRLRPQDLGALLAGGVTELAVRRKPRVGILPTGDEIRAPGQPLNVGEIVDSNSTVLSALIAEWGGEAKVWPIVADDWDQLENAVLAMEASQDILVIIAGSSQGRDDYTVPLIEKFGRIYAHGMAIKPGKPAMLGEIKGKPVIGIPGYPVSAFLTARLFLRAWIKHELGLPSGTLPVMRAFLNKKVFSGLGSEEFVRVKVGRVGERWVAAPISRGAGVTMSLVRADGILRVPRLQEGFHEGAPVQVELLRPQEELEETLICIGSHDLTLDLMDSYLKMNGRHGALASAHVGSLAGLMALRKGEAHLAGVHLLDPESGEYNRPYLERLLPQRRIALVNLVYRTQGLLVARGNPLKLRTLADLADGRLRFVNRQGGSGTRVLLDYLLAQEGVDKQQILGYDREEFTHLGVAVAIASGSADAGLGIQSAALSLGLDFIPIGEERYDLAIPQEYLADRRIEMLLEVIASPDFQAEVRAMGGYDLRDAGKFMNGPGETQAE
ncbi:Probable molybdopterin binding domain protein [Acididesulfobacillus acetoxydans]|uniref:Molybdopterin molybdenumtransferase n=1 Tax=Acididesulfobacillus acetoxydans TaxID=1561005 RepID=A0A8S0W7T0_9FIRM|nr:molybdopterin biosynthesis protein [Acididesulfobacillus acetoxydans]CAA7601089.1 Probable molybdopterin binding domain protein [Acididesulfobacillus acetoxydans]CEJ06963.1 Molybdopterin molybdenumtransferase [Acididesulfobacillus acetoxydans]